MKTLCEGFKDYVNVVIDPTREQEIALDSKEFHSRVFNAGAFTALSLVLACKKDDRVIGKLMIEAMMAMLIGSPEKIEGMMDAVMAQVDESAEVVVEKKQHDGNQQCNCRVCVGSRGVRQAVEDAMRDECDCDACCEKRLLKEIGL